MAHRLTSLVVAVALTVAGCGRSLKPAQQSVGPDRAVELWSAADAAAEHDLFWGPGGRDLAPRDEVYRFVAEKTTGKNPGFDVRDSEGRLWSWYDNPFIGTQPFGGLVAINLLLNNWDFKTSNNKLYLIRNPASGVTERRYVVRDLGGSLGKAYQPRLMRWIPFMRHMQGSKNRLDHFERQPFIDAIDGERVAFNYRGLDEALAKSVTLANLAEIDGPMAR